MELTTQPAGQTEQWHQITLDEYLAAKDTLKRCLTEIAEDYITAGYLLRQIKDTEAYRNEGYKSLRDFAREEYGLSESAVSRFIAINAKFSIGGYSDKILPEFRNFGSSRLSEMLTLPDEDCRLVTETTTIAAIREIKKFNREEKAVTEREAVNAEYGNAGETHTGGGRTDDTAAGDTEKPDGTAGDTEEPDWVRTDTTDEYDTETVTAEVLSVRKYDERQEKYDDLSQAIIDFFEDRRELLSEVYTLSDYEDIADAVNPSGSLTFRKGIHMLFMFEYASGITLKTLGKGNTKHSWAEFIEKTVDIYRDTYTDSDSVWENFYKRGKGKQEEAAAESTPAQEERQAAEESTIEQEEPQAAEESTPVQEEKQAAVEKAAYTELATSQENTARTEPEEAEAQAGGTDAKGITESEAIKEFRENIELPFGTTISNEASEMAISALEEIRQYRELGTVEEVQEAMKKQKEIEDIVNMQLIAGKNSYKEIDSSFNDIVKVIHR